MKMRRNQLLMEIANDLKNVADTIHKLLEDLDCEQKDSKETEIKKSEVKEITLEEVRARLAALSQDGKQAQVKALITEFGAKKLSDIPSSKYQELLEKAEVL